MENFRISQMQDKLTASFHVKSPCLTRILPCGLIYFYFQTQWMNDQCCWSNLWVLNKSIHRFSSTDIKTSRVQDCLYTGWMFILAVPCPDCDVLWKKWTCHTWLQPNSTPIPRCFFGSFLKKVMNKTCRWGSSQCIMSKGWTYSWLVLIHICILEPSSYKDSSQINLLPCFRILSDKFYVEVWQSGHLWGSAAFQRVSLKPILNCKDSLEKC